MVKNYFSIFLGKLFKKTLEADQSVEKVGQCHSKIHYNSCT